jgi:hypothetical protein
LSKIEITQEEKVYFFSKIKQLLVELSHSRTAKKHVRSDSAIKNLQKNFLKKEDRDPVSHDFIDRKMQSMNDSQGPSDFSGSAYNGPGNVDREKTNSNMGQRNFER